MLQSKSLSGKKTGASNVQAYSRKQIQEELILTQNAATELLSFLRSEPSGLGIIEIVSQGLEMRGIGDVLGQPEKVSTFES